MRSTWPTWSSGVWCRGLLSQGSMSTATPGADNLKAACPRKVMLTPRPRMALVMAFSGSGAGNPGGSPHRRQLTRQLFQGFQIAAHPQGNQGVPLQDGSLEGWIEEHLAVAPLNGHQDEVQFLAEAGVLEGHPSQGRASADFDFLHAPLQAFGKGQVHKGGHRGAQDGVGHLPAPNFIG